jgi:NAD(P)-dependent dehydrogenase (short-subunit alcohol dehydrogenase family)
MRTVVVTGEGSRIGRAIAVRQASAGDRGAEHLQIPRTAVVGIEAGSRAVKYQGSALLGTVVRPWLREEFDVDLL